VTHKLRTLAAFFLFFGLFSILPVLSLLFNKEVILLEPLEGAQWVRPDVPAGLETYIPRPLKSLYRKEFTTDGREESALIKVRARTGVVLRLDGQELPGSRVPDAWEAPLVFDMGPYLVPGKHELVIEAQNSAGVPVLAAVSGGLGLSTDSSWEASADAVFWKKAVLADRTEYVQESRQFTRADIVFLSELPLLAAIFAAVFALTVYCRGSGGRFAGMLVPSPRILSLAVMAALSALAINNFWKLSIEVGFDQRDHFMYITYIARNLSIPLAGEGWSMFQSPLYYMASAPVYSLFEGRVDDATLVRILRLIPAASSVLMVEAVYRASRHAFPERRDMQSIAVIIGGLLPMNIYLSRGLGNEMMAALFSSCAIAAGLGALRADKEILKKTVIMGVFFGLALLSKVTAALLAPFVAGVIILRFAVLERAGGRVRNTTVALSMSFGAAFIISGWYYIRNMIYLGSPLVGNWGAGSEWWQFPSYRLSRHFLSFGDSFFYPAFSSMGSFWDSLYSTMWMDANLSGVDPGLLLPNAWNYGVMFSGVWLAILPSAAIMTGIVLSLINRERARDGLLLLALCVALYIGALLDYYLKVPAYTTGKATYTSGITICYALLGALGLSVVMKGMVLRGVVYGWIACWAVYSYAAYFVIQ